MANEGISLRQAARSAAVLCGTAGVVIAAGVAGCAHSPAPGPTPKATPPGKTLPNVRMVAPPRQQQHARLPALAGRGVRALWQGDPSGSTAMAGGKVLTLTQSGHAAIAEATSASTGAPIWTTRLSGPLSQAAGLVVAGPDVVVEIGKQIGQAPAMVYTAVIRYVALSLDTGAPLWTARVGGDYPAPPIAAAGRVVLTGNTSGTVIARDAATGTVAWRDPPPSACPRPPDVPANQGGLSLASDGGLAVASFSCGRRVVVQRLDPATGRRQWTWTSAAVAAGASMGLSVAAAAREGSLVLLTGQIASPPAATSFLDRLPRPYLWPSRLGPRDEVDVVLALDASTGRPRWSELGGQMENFTLADRAVCETVNTGLECRDDVTGAPTLPVVSTGQGAGASPPYADDGYAGITGRIVAVTERPFRSGDITLRVLAVRGGATLALARLAIGTSAYGGANYQVFAVAAGPLPGGAAVVLVRRVDAPGYPVLALRVPG